MNRNRHHPKLSYTALNYLYSAANSTATATTWHWPVKLAFFTYHISLQPWKNLKNISWFVTYFYKTCWVFLYYLVRHKTIKVGGKSKVCESLNKLDHRNWIKDGIKKLGRSRKWPKWGNSWSANINLLLLSDLEREELFSMVTAFNA